MPPVNATMPSNNSNSTAAGPNPNPNPNSPLTPEQIAEFDGALRDFHQRWPDFQALPEKVKSVETECAQLQQHLSGLRRAAALRTGGTQRPRGMVSEECARHLAATFVAHCSKSGTLDALCSVPAQRDSLLQMSRQALNLSTRAALTTTEVPLPVQYGAELRDLVSEFGVVRKHMFPYPMGMGTARPARMGARPAFGSIAMSAAVPEKAPAFSFASLESHKVGGIVRVPRELDDQSIVALGQFLARYGAVEFARAEDTWGFLADGGMGYEQVEGIVQVARDAGKTVTLDAGKTKPSDATLDHFRALRRMVNKAVLNGRLAAYYLDTTWETRLSAFKTAAEPNVYQRLPDGSATLDGYPIVWTDVLHSYDTGDAPDKPLAVFGALSFWWFGEHGTPRMDTSEHVWFANDQLAVRFIEEIDFDYAANDATSALLTAEA